MHEVANYGTSIALGVCFGMIFGVLIDNLAMGLAMGPMFGIILHSCRPKKSEADGESSNDG